MILPLGWAGRPSSPSGPAISSAPAKPGMPRRVRAASPMIPSPESARRRRTGRLLEIGASLVLAAVLVYAGVVRRTHDTGLVRVADDQVAVIVDRSSGTSRVVQRPGYLPFVPLLEKVHLF